MEKLLALQAAAVMANGVMLSYATPSGPLPISAASPGVLPAETALRADFYWELVRSFYSAIIGADSDNVNWPPPPAAVSAAASSAVVGALAGSNPANVASAINALTTGTSPLALAVQALLKTIPAVQNAVAGPAAAIAPAPSTTLSLAPRPAP